MSTLITKGWNNVNPSFSGSNQSMSNSINALSKAGTIFDQLSSRLEQEQQNEFNNGIAVRNMALQEEQGQRLQEEHDYLQVARTETAQVNEMGLDSLNQARRPDGTIDLQKLSVELSNMSKGLTTAEAGEALNNILTTAFGDNDTLADNARADNQLGLDYAKYGEQKRQFDLRHALETQKADMNALKTWQEFENTARETQAKSAQEEATARASLAGVLSSVKNTSERQALEQAIQGMSPSQALAFTKEAVYNIDGVARFNKGPSGPIQIGPGLLPVNQKADTENKELLHNPDTRNALAKQIGAEDNKLGLSEDKANSVLLKIASAVSAKDAANLFTLSDDKPIFGKSDFEKLPAYFADDRNLDELGENPLFLEVINMRIEEQGRTDVVPDEEVKWLQKYYPEAVRAMNLPRGTSPQPNSPISPTTPPEQNSNTTSDLSGINASFVEFMVNEFENSDASDATIKLTIDNALNGSGRYTSKLSKELFDLVQERLKSN